MRGESMEVKFKQGNSIKVKFVICNFYYLTTRLEMFGSLKAVGMFDSHTNIAVIAAIY